jgi:ABC-type glutathione transport system ATPase component
MRLCHHSIQPSPTMKRYRCFVAIHLFLTTTCLLLSPSQKFGHGLALPLQSLPTTLRINQVSQSYPSTLFQTLFSSVPRREFAVHNITLEVQSELLDIIGASSSGKSTILRLVLGKDESPISGSVSWKPSGLLPVYLAQGKSSYAYDSSQTVHDVHS